MSAPTRLLHDPFRLCLLALIAVSLSRFGGYFGILRLLRPALLLFAFCVCYALLNRRKLFAKNLQGNPTVLIIGVLVLTTLGSAVFGISLGHAAVFIINDFSKTLAITLLIVLSIRDVTDVRRLCWAIALGGIVLAYLSIFVVGISKVVSGVSYDANDVGVLMVMTLPLALLLLQHAGGFGERLLALCGIVLLAMTIVKTQSRGAFIGALAVGGVMLLLPGLSAGRRLLFVLGAAATMWIAAPSGYWANMQSILEDPKADYNWDALNGRRNLAKRGMGYMLEYPAFGVGIDNFRFAEGTISEKAREARPGHGIRWAAAHNSFVQAGAEAGVSGLLLWTTLLLSNIVLPLRLRRRMPRAWRTGSRDERFLLAATTYVPAALVGFAVTAFFVSFAWMEPLYFLSALVAGLSIVANRCLARTAPVLPRTFGMRGIAAHAHSGSVPHSWEDPSLLRGQ